MCFNIQLFSPFCNKQSSFENYQKFGLEKKMHERFPDFVRFLEANNMKVYFSKFNHKIINACGEPALLYQGAYFTWSDLKRILFNADRITDFSLPHGFKYIDKGIVKESLVQWSVLSPCWKDQENPLPGQFFVELVSQERGFLGYSRHCFLRLIDDQTNVYSVGYGGKLYNWLPFRSSKGRFYSPDPSEFKDGKLRTTRIAITREQFIFLKYQIEKDQLIENFYFNLITRNCSQYTVELLKQVGIDINSQEYPTQALARRVCTFLKIRPPDCILKIAHYVKIFFQYLLSPVLNVLLLLLGAKYANPDLVKLEKENSHLWPSLPKKPLENFESIFDINQLKLSTGWKVSEWQDWVKKRRELTMEQLSETVAKRKREGRWTFEDETTLAQKVFAIQYGIPQDEADPDLPMRPVPRPYLIRV